MVKWIVRKTGNSMKTKESSREVKESTEVLQHQF
jgi:hypothetical protein